MKIVKADKAYENIPLLITKMFHARDARMLICLQSIHHSMKVIYVCRHKLLLQAAISHS